MTAAVSAMADNYARLCDIWDKARELEEENA